MSADNWAQCPRCTKRAVAEKDSLMEKARKSYGKVPAEDWMEMVKKAEQPISLKDNLREDYSFGILADGEFYVLYRCSCSVCGFEHEFKEEKKLDIGK